MSSLERKFRILIAPDKFKGSLSAKEVAKCIAATVEKRLNRAEIQLLPIADGGDGSLDLLLSNDFQEVKVQTYDALMEPVQARYGFSTVSGKRVAFLEMASICGIASLQGRGLQPQFASSYGLGDVAAQIIMHGVDEILVSVGGSASIDGGLGFLVGLGAIIKNEKGSRIPPNLSGLEHAVSIDLALLHPSIHPLTSNVKWKFLVDVSNPLVGPEGAAYVFGPQKGLRLTQLESADRSLLHWARILEKVSGTDVSTISGAGAAGGVACPGLALFGASLMSGAEWFAGHLNLDQKISDADLVITGEGSFDSQSFAGKGPGYVIEKSRASGKTFAIVAGQIEPGLTEKFRIPSVSLTELAGSPELALKDPEKWLSEATNELLNRLDTVSEPLDFTLRKRFI